MLDWLRRLWQRAAPAASRRFVRASYDNARTDDSNRRHWANADALSASAANDLAVRKKLRERSRYESVNNSYCQGLLLTLANDLVGSGPRLALLTGDEAFNDAVELRWQEWADRVLFGHKLHTLKQAKSRDGEAFLFLTSDDRAEGVTLDVRLVECDQVCTPWPLSVQGAVDGLQTDARGRVTGYYLLREHPGDLVHGQPMAYDVVSPRFLLHWFRQDRPGQYRGVPELTASLGLFAQMRRYTLAVLTAAETAASFAATLESEAPPDGSDTEATPFDTLEIERGMMTTLPSGMKLQQLKAEQPTTTYSMFKTELLKEIGRSANAPFNVTAGDSSPYNYSSARMDHLLYRSSLQVERDHCRLVVLEPVFRAWLDEALRIPGYLPQLPAGVTAAALPHSWYWPSAEPIDPEKEALADTIRLNNHTATLAELLAEKGRDWQVWLRQRGREVALMKELGMELPPVPEQESSQKLRQEAPAASPGGFGAAAYLAASARPADGVQIRGASEGFELLAEQSGEGLKKFKMVAYTGVAMKVGFGWPVVVDLAGLKVPGQRRPILRDHDSTQIVGHTESIEVSEGGRRLHVTGVISGVGEAAQEVVALAGRGFPWQSSIGASAERMEFIDRDQTVKVNGRSFDGPIYVARATTLGEVSFVPMGADPATSASVAAQEARGGVMTFEQWLAARSIDPAGLTDAVKLVLQAAWKAETAPAPAPAPTPAPAPAPTPAPAPGRDPNGNPTPAGGPAGLHARLAEAAARETHEARISARLSDALDLRRISSIDAERIRAESFADPSRWDDARIELEFIRCERPKPGHFQAPRERAVTDDVVECAVCQGAGLPGLESHFKEATLEAAHARFPRGMALSDLIMLYARRGGYTGGSVKANPEAAWSAARRAQDVQAAGSWGPSTQGATIGSMLAAVANKFLRSGFDSIESSWRAISAVRPASDFKTITTYSLTGDLTFQLLKPGGEIQHGQVDATGYTNRVDTYARMLGLDRRDVINDDLNAFGSVARRLGRGGAIALNKLFWGQFLNNSTFFASGNNNVITGGTSALALAGLDLAHAKFLLQTDPDGNILGVMPKILLVPPALWATANTLMSSTALVSGATTAPGTPSNNIWAGMFRVVSSAYMQDSTLTGNSAAAWYLLADPADLPVIEVAFLNGVETPTVESTDGDFGMLGTAFRGYFDIGVSKQEYRGGVRAAGS